MDRKNLDLLVVATLCVLNVLWALLPSHDVPGVGLVLALPLVFLLPGYVLVQVLLPRRSLDRSQQLVLCLGLSFVLDIVAGLLLNVFPGGLRATSWSLLLGLLTLGGVLLALAVRRRTIAIAEPLPEPKWPLTHLQALALELAMVVAALSVVYSASGVLQGPQTTFTQLWLLPADQAQQQCAVQLGVRNFEASVRTYRVEMTINGTRVHTWSPVVLEPQHSWEQHILLSKPKTSSALAIVVRLYQDGAPQKIYRSVNLTLHALPGLCVEKVV